MAAQALGETYYGRLQGLRVVGKRNSEPDNVNIVLRGVGFALIYLERAEGRRFGAERSAAHHCESEPQSIAQPKMDLVIRNTNVKMR